MGLTPAQPTGPRTAPRVFRSAQDRCARPALVPPGATERFPGYTGGRSPAVAKAVARARSARGPLAKVTGGEDRGKGLDGKSRLSVSSGRWCCPFPERQDGRPGPRSVRLTRTTKVGRGSRNNCQGAVAVSCEKCGSYRTLPHLPIPKIF